MVNECNQIVIYVMIIVLCYYSIHNEETTEPSYDSLICQQRL